MKREKKDFCRYAVFDGKTGVMLACGEKYKVNRGLNYDRSFSPWSAGFRRIAEYSRHAVIKGVRSIFSIGIILVFASPFVPLPLRARF